MKDAIVLGGGISGLTAAYLLEKQGLDVCVIEKRSQAGGPIRSTRADGYLVEQGPNSLLLPEPWVETLIDELGLGSELQETSPAAQKRYIVKAGRTVPAPVSPIQAVSTPLFSFGGKLGFLAEPFRRRLPDAEASKETVADFVRRRMGKDFLDYAIDPFVSGVYAGDPNQLILEYAFPLMRGFERDGGSIIRGAIQRKRQQKSEGTSYKKRSISFREGLAALPRAISRKLGERLFLESEVITVDHSDRGAWRITWKRGRETFEASASRLIVCLPSHAIKAIRWPESIAAKLQETPDLAYPAVHSLALGFRRDQVAHPLDGFGMLVPSKEPESILGALFSSSLFPGRAPEQHCLLTVMIGGVRRPEFATMPREQLAKVAMKDLRPLLEISGSPSFVECASWPRAIPQYTREFGPWRDGLRAIEASYPTLRFGGNSVDGIAMGAAILSGRRLAGAASSPE